jgi:hypothetical protein
MPCIRNVVIAIIAGLFPTLPALAADAGDIAEGMRIFREKASCQSCHGWAGDGRKMDSQMPDGANLRESALDRASLVLTVKCGRPGRDMPAYDRLAYSDGRCYGLKDADVRKLGLSLFEPAATLQPREVEALADFLMAKVIGKGAMDRAQCVDYWGSAVEVCNELKK